MEELGNWVWGIKKKKSQAQMAHLDNLHGNQMGGMAGEIKGNYVNNSSFSLTLWATWNKLSFWMSELPARIVYELSRINVKREKFNFPARYKTVNKLRCAGGGESTCRLCVSLRSPPGQDTQLTVPPNPSPPPFSPSSFY